MAKYQMLKWDSIKTVEDVVNVLKAIHGGSVGFSEENPSYKFLKDKGYLSSIEVNVEEDGRVNYTNNEPDKPTLQ